MGVVMDESYVLKKITQLRLQKGISEVQLGKAIGKGKSYIHAVVSKEITLSMPVFLKICAVLNVSPSTFLF